MYTQLENGYVQRDDGAVIPPDPANADYQAFLSWMHAGNVPKERVPTLDEYRARVNTMREQKINAGVEWNGIPFDSNDVSRANLTGVIAAINAGIALPAGFSWRNAANVDVPMTAAELVELAAVMFAHVDGCYTASFALKDALEQAADPSTVDLTAGWPA